MHSLKFLLTASFLAAALMGYSPGGHAQMRLWGTYYGGTKGEQTNKVVSDPFGNIYVVGNTMSATGIATASSFDPTKLDPNAISGFLAKFDTNGKRVWGTYYGDGPAFPGAATDLVDVALDGSGNNVYVLGYTKCPSQGLATPDAYQTQCQGLEDVYLAKFDFTGKRIWGTYLGGPGQDTPSGLTVVSNGDVYITGVTRSSQGIATIGSADSSLGGNSDAFVAKFAAAGNLLWSRYFGGSGEEYGWDIVCKGSIRPTCFITGATDSSGEIATPGAHDILLGEAGDAFVARLSGVNGSTEWSTYYGGSGEDQGLSIAADANLNVYVGGYTTSFQDIATPNGFDGSWNGHWDMFVTKFNGIGQQLIGTYYGNDEQDYLLDLKTDISGNVYMLGMVRDGFSNVSLTTPNAYDTTINPNWEDAIIVKFNPNLGRVWATYYGGISGELFDNGGIDVGINGRVYLTGATQSSDSIATPGSHKQELQPVQDAFLVEFAQ